MNAKNQPTEVSQTTELKTTLVVTPDQTQATPEVAPEPVRSKLSEINWRYITGLFNQAVKGKLGPAEREAFEGVAENLLNSKTIDLEQLAWIQNKMKKYNFSRKVENV